MATKPHIRDRRINEIRLKATRKQISQDRAEELIQQLQAQYYEEDRLDMLGDFHKGLTKVNSLGTGVPELDQEIRDKVGEWKWD